MEQANSTAYLIFQTTLLLGIPQKISKLPKHYYRLNCFANDEKMH